MLIWALCAYGLCLPRPTAVRVSRETTASTAQETAPTHSRCSVSTYYVNGIIPMTTTRTNFCSRVKRRKAPLLETALLGCSYNECIGKLGTKTQIKWHYILFSVKHPDCSDIIHSLKKIADTSYVLELGYSNEKTVPELIKLRSEADGPTWSHKKAQQVLGLAKYWPHRTGPPDPTRGPGKVGRWHSSRELKGRIRKVTSSRGDTREDRKRR